MSLSMQHILQHLFQVKNLEEVPRQRLEELVEEYPSFGVGRYLLSRKLQTEASDHFSGEAQKANLYFTNPFWLQWLLQDRPSSPDATAPTESSQPDEWNAMGDAGLPAEDIFAPVLDNTEETIHTDVIKDVIKEEEPEFLPEPAGPSAADLLLKSIAELQDQRQAQLKEEEASREESAPAMGIAGMALEQAEDQENVPVEEPAQQDEPASVTDLEEKKEQPTEIKAPEEAPVASTDATPPGENANGAISPQGVIFEPYYTVDYFASQGIRLVLDENPSDRLGKQMKSFTDWLKVMRRLPQKNREIIPDLAAEHTVQAIAAHSIESREVITETMAEVLAKQGMREKATEMYRKLSLLEPEKSAYFAEKIEQLKII